MWLELSERREEQQMEEERREARRGRALGIVLYILALIWHFGEALEGFEPRRGIRLTF